MAGNQYFFPPERLGEGEVGGRRGENYGDLGQQSNEDEEDEQEGEDEDSDEDHADNGEERRFNEYRMQFDGREPASRGAQTRNGGRKIPRANDRVKDAFIQSSNRTNPNSLGQQDSSLAYQEADTIVGRSLLYR